MVLQCEEDKLITRLRSEVAELRQKNSELAETLDVVMRGGCPLCKKTGFNSDLQGPIRSGECSCTLCCCLLCTDCWDKVHNSEKNSCPRCHQDLGCWLDVTYGRDE